MLLIFLLVTLYVIIILYYLFLQIYDIISSLHRFSCYIHSMQTFWDRVILLLNSPTVVELSTMLDVKRSTLSSWIHTDRRPPLHVAMKIMELTGVSLEWLEHGNNWESMASEEAAENISQYKKLIMAQIEELDQQQLEVIQALLYYFKNHSATNQTLKKDS